MDQNDFLKGALIGGCVAGVLAIFLAPKSGKALRQDIADGCDTINKESKRYAGEISDRAHSFMDALQGIEHEELEDNSHAYLAGGAAGAILGALAGLLLAPKSGEKLREYFGDEFDHMRDKAKSVVEDVYDKEQHFEDKLGDWKDILVNIVDKLSHVQNKKGSKGNSLGKIFDWATIGLQLYHKVQGGR
ncbi:MAG: YtxH domain-containing protein [Parachlamydiaceae bacterium]|nr:YtxH domain-containing protein [Parachlamydiaceae bacterium]